MELFFCTKKATTRGRIVEAADELALHVLARSQGIATLANAFHSEKFIRQELRQFDDWLDTKITS